VKEGPGIDIPCDIRNGLPLDSDSIDYAVSIHALPELSYPDLAPALAELRRVLKPSGVLRLSLPDLLKGIDAYQRGDHSYFLVPDEDALTLGGKLAVQLTWYGYSRSLFTPDFAEELLLKAGFRSVDHVSFGETSSPFPGIVELDNREAESLFIEATK
jgi:SAM-dependent methyltransferase